MGKKKFIDKKKAVMFRLVPAVDKNNEHRILLQHVQTKNSKLSESEKHRLIEGLSNEKEFDMKKVEPVDPRFEGIPPEILEKIKGRTDLVINQKGWNRQRGDQDDDDEEDIKIEEVDEEGEDEDGEYAKDNDGELDEGDMEDEIEYIDNNEEDEWVDEDDSEHSDDQCDEIEIVPESPTKSEQSPIKLPRPPIFTEEDFPEISKPANEQQALLQQQKMQLTDEQLMILNSVLPANYKQMELKGVKMKKFDDMGLPLDDGRDYDKYFSKGGGEIIAAMYSDTAPNAAPDVDIKPEEVPEDAKDVEDCLNEGEGYEELEDDFFIKLMKDQGTKVQIKKPENKQATKKDSKGKSAPAKKPSPPKKVEEQEEVSEVKKPKKAQKQPSEQEQEEYEDIDDQDITDEQLEKAIKDFDAHKEFESKVKFDLPKNKSLEEQFKEAFKDEKEEEQGEIPFHELSKKDKLRFMRNHKATEPEDVQKEQLEQKLNSVGHCIKPEEMHLRKIYEKLPVQQDIAMQQALQNDDAGSIQSSQSSSDHDDIVSYREKNSTIFTTLNYVEEEKKKKSKKPKPTQPEVVLKEMPKPPVIKINRNETKQQKKARKEQLKQFKKERKQAKKQFIQELSQQRRVVAGNSQAPLYGVSRITIL